MHAKLSEIKKSKWAEKFQRWVGEEKVKLKENYAVQDIKFLFLFFVFHSKWSF